MTIEFKPLKWGDGKKRKPTRTLRELSDEFEIDIRKLQSAMHHYGGPKPSLRHSSNSARSAVAYYDHDAVRKWWKDFKGMK